MQCQTCGSSNKIKLNDKHYCSECGSRLEKTAAVSQPPKPPTVPKAAAKAIVQLPKSKSKHVLDLSQHQPLPGVSQPARSTLSLRAHPSESKTVKQPQPVAQTIHGVRKPTTPKIATSAKTPQLTVQQKPKARQQRAQQVARSQHIQKFPASLKAAAELAESTPEPVTLNPQATYIVNKRTMAADAAAAIAMHHQRFAQPTTDVEIAEPAKPKTKPANFFKRFSQLFSNQPRFAMASTVALCVLVLAGYVSYLNYPNLSLRIAASRAGIDANLPGYTPSGYSLRGPVEYGDGQITVRFTSNSDAGFINLSQSKTSWDSASLLENYVLKRNKNYLTFQEKGLTIYMYGGNNAAWVNGGVFYSIEGNSYLSSEQILKMATSL